MLTFISALGFVSLGAQAATLKPILAKPLPSNAGDDDWITKFNPSMAFFDGCAPITRYNADGLIKSAGIPDDEWGTCKDPKHAQVYGYHHSDSGMFLYAWYSPVNVPSFDQFDYQWQYMAVYPDIIDGVMKENALGIWTAVSGYTETFSKDILGHHPLIDQYRQSDDTAAAMRTGNSFIGHRLPLIDVSNRSGSWTVKADMALMMDDDCPLGASLLEETMATIVRNPDGIGYPTL